MYGEIVVPITATNVKRNACSSLNSGRTNPTATALQSGRDRKAEREGRTKEKKCACHGTAFHEDGHFQVWTATCVIWKVFFNATILVRAGVPGRHHVPNATACAGRAVV